MSNNDSASLSNKILLCLQSIQNYMDDPWESSREETIEAIKNLEKSLNDIIEIVDRCKKESEEEFLLKLKSTPKKL